MSILDSDGELFQGHCKHCSFVWRVADRVPNYCPECGKPLYANHDELMTAKNAIRRRYSLLKKKEPR